MPGHMILLGRSQQFVALLKPAARISISRRRRDSYHGRRHALMKEAARRRVDRRSYRHFRRRRLRPNNAAHAAGKRKARYRGWLRARRIASSIQFYIFPRCARDTMIRLSACRAALFVSQPRLGRIKHRATDSVGTKVAA